MRIARVCVCVCRKVITRAGILVLVVVVSVWSPTHIKPTRVVFTFILPRPRFCRHLSSYYYYFSLFALYSENVPEATRKKRQEPFSPLARDEHDVKNTRSSSR